MDQLSKGRTIKGTNVTPLLNLKKSYPLKNKTPFRLSREEIYSISSITNKTVAEFCENVMYGGKVKLTRKYEHAIAGKLIINKQLPFKKISAKLSTNSQLWEHGCGITVLFCFVFVFRRKKFGDIVYLFQKNVYRTCRHEIS